MLCSNAKSDTFRNELHLILNIGEEQFEEYTFRLAKVESQSGTHLNC